MSLTREEMDRKIDEHFGYEAADDVEGVLATLAPEAVHDIVGYPTGPTRDKDAIRAFYVQLFGDLAESKTKVIKRLYGDNFLVDESLWEGTAPGRPFGIEGNNKPLKFRLLHVIEFARGGRISREQVWVDMAAILHQLTRE